MRRDRSHHGAKKSVLRLLTTFVAATLLLLGLGGSPARAASAITPTNVVFTMDPYEFTETWGGSVTMNFNFCVPNTAQAGDYLTLTLPSVFDNFPAGFDVKMGEQVSFKATIDDSQRPAVVRFVLTDEGAATDNLCARTQFGGALAGNVSEGTYDATYQINGGAEITLDTPIKVVPIPDTVFEPPTSSWKSAWFEEQANQCRDTTDGCLVFQFVVQADQGSRIVIDDPAGSNWQWACGWMNNQFGTGAGWQDFYVMTYDGHGGRTVKSPRDTPALMSMITKFTCTPDNLHVEMDTSGLTANQNVELYFHASASVPGEAGGIKYSNTGTLTLTEPVEYHSSTQSTWIGGISEGDFISIVKNDIRGNKADTQATAVSVPSGTTQLALTVRNTGTTDLRNLKVIDTIVVGSGTVSDLSCDFSPYGGPSTGTDGGAAVLPSGKALDCTATLTGVVDLHEDVAKVTATGNGNVEASNPFWATGVMNLVLAKKLRESGPFAPGQTVHFDLTPANHGNATALAGWSVTDLLPDGLTAVGISSTDPQYTCVLGTLTCTSSSPLAAGASGPVITVEATIDAGFVGTAHNVAYVSPADGDTETNPLVVPKQTTDTDDSDTDNDAQDDLTVAGVSVGDYVWLDANRNGLQDAGEAGVAGVTVTLKDSTGATVGSPVTTGADGYYWFTGLAPGANYTLEFTRPDGYSWTTQDASGVTDNNLTTDADDSDVVAATGAIAFTAPATGANAPGAPDKTDNPTLDGGLVSYNLTLDKALTTTETLRPGSEVTFTLTPHNEGPATALAGWSVTEVLPAGLTLTSMTGSTPDYSCDVATLTCTNTQPFPANADLGYVTVVATVDATAVGEMQNVAYVDKSGSDVPETTPLGAPPTTDTDTGESPTDNDDSVPLAVTPYVSVGDYVWYDVNRDGLQDATDVPFANMTVELYAGSTATGTPVQTTHTDAAGYYAFVGLDPSTQYTIRFVPVDGEIPTPANASGVTSNSPTADLTDSDPASDGTVTFTTPATGTNSGEPTKADNPGIDAGFVSYNLRLLKTLTTDGPFVSGKTVTFVLTPHNDGPVDALAGWSVTEVLPAGLTLVSMTGEGYSCTDLTCVAEAPLAAGTDGAPITVVAKVGQVRGKVHNVAYVAPSGDDVAETNPLAVPTTDTDTSTTPTDNDAQADLVVRVEGDVLPQTGTGAELALLGVAGALVVAGAGVLIVARRRKARG